MKTQTFSEIAIEAIVTISLIALLGLLTALVYALLTLLSPATPTPQFQAPQTTAKNPTATKPTSAATTFALSSVKTAPKLEAETKEESPQLIPEVATNPKTDYRKFTLKELRPLAKDRNILNWKTLKKNELITAISA
jgi:hypothetical protein